MAAIESAPFSGPIAVVGLAARFPGANTVQGFWENLCQGTESITFGAGPSRPGHVNAAGMLEEADHFDASFFEMSGRDAALTDPQHRVFLELAWEALEDAACDPRRSSAIVGVFAGCARNSYFAHNLAGHPEISQEIDRYQTIIGSEDDYLASRTAFKLDLRGPAVTVKTACSTSLVALHLACRSLRDGECSMALAGAVSVKVPFDEGHPIREGSMYSPDGHTRPFDRDASGTLFGSGGGVLVLMPLTEALNAGHTIHAVIRGTAINNDGATKESFTAPSIKGQSRVIREALARAETDAASIHFIEAHGTGTQLGDPVELDALNEVFSQRGTPLLIGSVKGNIGHADAAAGMAGLIKSILALRHRTLPPSINCPNPVTLDSNFELAAQLRPIKITNGCPLRCGVTSLGFGGTNAHAVLEEAPPTESQPVSREWQILTLSARNETALATACERLADYLRENPDSCLADVAWTLQVGRREFTHRRAVVCRTVDEAIAALEGQAPRRSFSAEAKEPARKIAFTFPGHGSHYVGMTRRLYQSEPVFREALDECAEALLPHLGFDLRPTLFPTPEFEAEAQANILRTDYIQSSLFMISYAFACLWRSWGVRPSAVIGYSIGELSAACVTGMLSLSDAAKLVAARASLIHTLPPGAMLAVGLSEEEVAPFLNDEIDIGALSAPQHTILSGPHAAMDTVEKRLSEARVGHRRIEVPHAFHSRMMEPVLGSYREALLDVSFEAPNCDFISTVDGCRQSSEALADPGYWQREMIEPVRFSDAIVTLAAEPDWTFLEVGPSQLLSALTRGHPAVGNHHVVLSSNRNERDATDDVEFTMIAAARLWLNGHSLDWAALHHHQQRTRISLPCYPFQRQRYWIDAPAVRSTSPKLSLREWTEEASSPETASEERANDTRSQTEIQIAAIWSSLLDCQTVKAQDNFLDQGGNSLTAVQLLARVREKFGHMIPLREFLENPTLGHICAALDSGETGDADDDETLRALLDEIEAMSPDEVSAQLCSVPEPPEALELLNTARKPSIDLSLMFFAADADAGSDPYRLVMDAAGFADQNGFSSVWMPERHFHRFGGLYPNPAVLGAALAARTQHVGIRAGSIITPLHDPLRLVEDWAMIDQISGGRVGIAFAAGFHPRDFALAPDRFENRHALTEQIMVETRKLWKGGAMSRVDGAGDSFKATPYPRPLQKELPTWITATRSIDTFRLAGKHGANVLTAMIRLSVDELRERVTAYREALSENGHDPSSGQVTLMLHTYVGADEAEVRRIAEGPLLAYLRAHMNFMNSNGEPLRQEEANTLLADAFERYWSSASLIGTVESCAERLSQLHAAGIDDVACLIDFGIDHNAVMGGMKHLASLRTLARNPIPTA
ncbi:type I polyketide synthase [Haloferula sp.]|uniref:type I polyketide synthase n=1 Tax=Haloferula sp. TaxID=2497595 RepID=UPI003C75D891